MGRLVVVLLALVAAVCAAVGIVLRQRATSAVPAEQGMSTTIVATLSRKPSWWIGTAVALGGYVCQAIALSLGSLLLVQPLLMSSLLFALPISARLSHRKVSAMDSMWAIVLTVGLAICVVLAARASERRRAVLLAVAVAVLFATVAVLTKISTHRLAVGGWAALLSVPAPYLLAVVAVAATVLQQSAFHAGALQTSVPTMLVAEPLVAVLLGVIVLGERLAVSGPIALLLPVAVVAMAASTIALGRDTAAAL
jgi:drug/metabolite transporter (DMT)-like permease